MSDKIVSLEELKLYKQESDKVLNKLNNDVKNRIDAEEAERKAEDTALSHALEQEAETARAAESDISHDLRDEASFARSEEERIEGDLNALKDTLDSTLAIQDGNTTFKNDVVIQGDLDVKGTTTTVDQETVQSVANLIVTNSTNAPLTGYTGIVALKGENKGYQEVTFDSKFPYVKDSFYYLENNEYILDSSEEPVSGRTYYAVKAEGAALYDPINDQLVLGEGVYGGGNFKFDDNQAEALATRADIIADGNLVKWDDQGKIIVDADENIAGLKAYTDNKIAALDLGTVGSNGGYIKTVSQEDGQVSATLQAFDTVIDENSTDDSAPTSKAVYDTAVSKINALNVNPIGQAGSYIKIVDQTQGLVGATSQAFDTDMQNATDNNAPTTLNVKTYTDAETTRATNAETALSNDIATEAQARATAITNLTNYTNEKFKTDAFIICTTDEEVAEYLEIETYIGKYIRFEGESASGNYENGHFYLIESIESPAEINNWDTVNENFEDSRGNLQSAVTYSTELPLQIDEDTPIIGQGRIDIEQNLDITNPVTFHNPGLTSDNNPRYDYDSSTSNNGYRVDWNGGSGLSQQANVKRINVGSNDGIIAGQDNSIILTARSYWTAFRTDEINSTLTYNPGSKKGIMLGLAVNRMGFEKKDRSTLTSLANNIRSAHTIKVHKDTLSAKLRLNLELFERTYRDNLQENADTTNEVIGSIWAVYTNLQGVQIPVKVYEHSININGQTIKDNQEAAISSGVIQVPEYSIPLASIATNSDYKEIELYEVLEVYKKLGPGSESWGTLTNALYVYGWAAFTDLQLLTTIPSTVATEVYATKVDKTELEDLINAEAERATAAEQALDERLDVIEPLIPADATSSNKLTTEAYVALNGGKIDTLSINGDTSKLPIDENKNVDFAVDGTYDAINNKLATESTVSSAIAGLDVASQGGTGKYIKAISEADGIISATEQAYDTNFSAPTNDNAPTTLAAKTYTDEQIAALDVASIAVGADKTLVSISETDGKISAATQSIQIAESQVTDLETDLNSKADLADIAAEYDSSKTYDIGDAIIYNQDVYSCNTDNTTGAFEASKWVKKSVEELRTKGIIIKGTAYKPDNSGMITLPSSEADLLSIEDEPTEDSENLVTSGGVYDALATKTDLTNIADEYDNTLIYAVGDLAIYEGVLYRCATAVETAEAFDSSKWTQKTVDELLDTKADSSDLSNYVTLDGTQTITGVKTFKSDRGTTFINDGLSGININGTFVRNRDNNTGVKFWTDIIRFTEDIAPDGYDTDLGTASQKWRDLYLSGNLIDGTNSVSIANIVNRDELSNYATTTALQEGLATKQDALTFATDTDIDDIFTSVGVNESDSISNDTLNLGNETSISQSGDTIRF